MVWPLYLDFCFCTFHLLYSWAMLFTVFRLRLLIGLLHSLKFIRAGNNHILASRIPSKVLTYKMCQTQCQAFSIFESMKLLSRIFFTHSHFIRKIFHSLCIFYNAVMMVGGGMKNGFFKLPTKEIIGFVITLRHSHFSKTTSIFNLMNSYFFPFSCLSF